MQDVVFKSPVAFAQAAHHPELATVNGMTTAIKFAEPEVESARRSSLSICDVSCLSRFGVKGPKAVEWLKSSATDLPASGNSWIHNKDGSLVMRLGNSEYLIEDQPTSHFCSTLNQREDAEQGVHIVTRSDASFILSGELIDPLFSEVCHLELSGQALDDNQLVMTLVAGVSATLLRQDIEGQTIYRLWCDGTYGPYLWKTLLGIIEELGGGPVGFNVYYKTN